MRWSTRVFLSSLAAVLSPLIVLALVGLPSVSSRLSQSAEADLHKWSRAAAALVTAALDDLQREARLLARDPAVIQGVLKGDWGTLARGTSPRMLALTLEGVADLVLIVDERGAPLVRVPAASGSVEAGLPTGAPAPVGTVQVVGGVPMLLGAVQIVDAGRSLGTVVVGRKFESLAKPLAAGRLRVELLVLGERSAYTTLAGGTAGVSWAEATRAGRVQLAGTSYLVRPVGRWGDVGLWLLAPDTELRATQGLMATWFVAFLLFAGCATFLAGWVLTRRVLQPIEAIREAARRLAAGDFDARIPPGRAKGLEDVRRAFDEMGAFLQHRQREVEHRNRELEALNAVALTLNRSIDLVPTLEEALEVVRRVTEMDVAALYKAGEAGQGLSLVAQRGLSPELVASVGARVQDSPLGRAIRTGRPAVVRGPSGSLRRDSPRTQIALPIPVKAEVWGAMLLTAAAAREFTSEELQLLEAVAYQVGAAVERVLLFQETRDKEHRLESLVEVAQTVTARLDADEVFEGVVQAALGLVPESSVRLWVAEEGRLVLRHEGGTGTTPFGGRKTTFAFGEGLTGHVVQTGEPLVVDQVLEDPRTVNVEWMGREGYVSFAGVPLLFQGRVLGVLAILTRRLTRFSKEDIKLLTSFTTQAAIAIENARLYADASRSAVEYQALFEVAGLVGSTLKVERVLDVIVERARALLKVRAAGIFKLDPRSQLLLYERGIGLSREFIESLQIHVGEGTSGKAMQYRAPAWSSDLLDDPTIVLREPTRDLVEREGYRAALSVPILIKGNPYGVLAVYWWDAHSLAFSEVRLLSALAGQAAVALDSAQLYEAVTRRGKRLETLAELTQTLTATLRVEEVLNRVVNSAVELFGSSVSRLWLVEEDGGTLSLRAHAGSTSQDLGFMRMRVGEGLVGRIVETKAPLVVADLREDPRPINRERHVAEGVISYAGAPMLLGDRALGALGIALRELHEFSEEEVSLLQSLANHAAIALENARLYQTAARRAARMHTLAEMGQLLVSTFDAEHILETMVTRCRESLDISDVGIFFLDEENAELRFVHGFGSREAYWRVHRLGIGEGVAGRAVAENRPVWTSDVLNDPAITLRPETRTRLEAVGTRAVLAIPLSGERAFGALVVHRDPGHRFSDEEREFLITFANHVAVALENARLFSLEQSRRAQVTRAFQELATAQDQLIRTEKLRALGEMASGVAHDFNNLLASILGRAQLLLRKVEDPKFRQWLQVIERAATDGARTVRRIQEFARIRRDQPFVPVNLNAVVKEALEVTQPRWREEAQSQGVTIEVTTSLAPVPEIAGDPAELREALTNLILNAVDAMPEGGVLSLSTRATDGRVIVTVSDTGVGISEEVQRQIFDPFFTTKGPKGTGLGLSITYGIVSRHSGQITVESAVGRGSTFSLTFPISPAEPERPSAPALAVTSPVRCLVVDDEPLVLEAMGDLLTTAGHSAVLVSNGAEAIARFKAEPFDLVLADLAMPRVNGWQLARAVKAHDPSVPVLLVTGLGVELSPEELLAHGVDAVLPKPVKLEDILSAVATFASRRQHPPASMKDAS